jgi:GntR family transcriptional regulator/MocR family aminotransferase
LAPDSWFLRSPGNEERGSNPASAILVVPAQLVEAFTAMKYVNDRHTAMLQQRTLATFLSEGHFERHVRRSRVRNAARSEALMSALCQRLGDRVQIAGENSGLHLLVWMPELKAAAIPELVQAAEKRGRSIRSCHNTSASRHASAWFSAMRHSKTFLRQAVTSETD